MNLSSTLSLRPRRRAAAFAPRSEVRGARPPQALPGTPSCPAGCAPGGPGHLEFFRAPDVFREGAENRARGGRAPHSISESAFTMVEIALSLAIVGFALVAIIGVLPAGLNVQKENREDTVINQDATLFLNAIRNGDQGYDELTNYVERITVYRAKYEFPSLNPVQLPPDERTVVGEPTLRNNPDVLLNNGNSIVGMLSTPKIQFLAGGSSFISNHVVAYVRAFSGNASEKVSRDNEVRDLSFSYRLISEVTPSWYPDFLTYQLLTNRVSDAYSLNSHELRLVFSWPLIPPLDRDLNMATNIGSSRLIYRTQVGGLNRPFAVISQPAEIYLFRFNAAPPLPGLQAGNNYYYYGK